MSGVVWIAFLVLGLAAAGAYPALDEVAARSWLLPGVLAATAAAVAAGIRLHRPVAPRPWFTLLAAVLLLLASAVVSAPALGLDAPWMTFEQLLAMAALGGFALSAVQLAAGRTAQGQVITHLDAVIVWLALVTVLWSVGFEPLSLAAGGLSRQLIYALSPMLPAAAVAALVRALLATRSRPLAGWLALAAMAGTLVGQLAVAELVLFGRWDPGWVGGALWLGSSVALGTAALHPSMRTLNEPVTEGVSRASGLRLVVFALALLVAPLSLRWAAEGAVLAVAGGVGVGILVLARVAGLLRHQERAEAAVRAHLHHDDLTGLPNRRWLLDALGDRLTDPARLPVTVVFLDLDGFKEINDLHGHEMGDAVLRVLARRVADAVGEDDLFGRFAGDEFVVLRSGDDPDGVSALVDAVRDAIIQPIKLSRRTFELDASIGAAVSSADDTAEDVLLRADAAMYRAKARGPGRFSWFDETLRAAASRRANLDRWLRDALPEGQFTLAYQPVWRLAPAGEPVEPVAAEVLLRWRHPTAGAISPAEFVPAAERNGTIVEIGAWIIERAIAQLARWRDTLPDGENLSLLLNLSPAQLDGPGLVDHIASALQRHGVPPGRIGLELTETALLRDIDEIRGVLDELDELGLRLALDDFGTGYSSLEHLRYLPVRLIKVDGSFVAGLDQGCERDRRIVAAVAGLGTGLDLPVLAEGVETAAQAAAAARLGCRYAQGFAFAKPMPAEPFATRLSRRIGVAGWAGSNNPLAGWAGSNRPLAGSGGSNRPLAGSERNGKPVGPAAQPAGTLPGAPPQAGRDDVVAQR